MQKKGALRVGSAYRTVSEPSVMVIEGVIPVALVAKEHKAVYRHKGENLREVVACEEHQRTFVSKRAWRFSDLPTQDWEDSLLIVCSAMEWRTTLNTPFSIAKGGTIFVSRNRVAHYVRALLIAEKIELDLRRGRMVTVSLN